MYYLITSYYSTHWMSPSIKAVKFGDVQLPKELRENIPTFFIEIDKPNGGRVKKGWFGRIIKFNLSNEIRKSEYEFKIENEITVESPNFRIYSEIYVLTEGNFTFSKNVLKLSEIPGIHNS